MVSLFVRSHPFIPSMWLLQGDADVVTPGQVVAMDLGLDRNSLVGQFSKRVQRDLRKAQLADVRVREVPFHAGIDDFMSVYKRDDAAEICPAALLFSKRLLLKTW